MKDNFSALKVGADFGNQLFNRPTATRLSVGPLMNEARDEVLAFLLERPVHTFGLAGFVRDIGLDSPLNRGSFYGCRDAAGRLEGVALIGHATMFETKSDAAIEAFAHLAKTCPDVYLVLGEQEKVEFFLSHYERGGCPIRLIRREVLLEQRWPTEARNVIPDLRLATPSDFDLVVPVHALTVFDESGVNPLEVCPDEFRQRCARRIDQGRTWVWIDNNRLIFKAEVFTDTHEVVYLEGICVAPEQRGKGYGRRCLSQLGSMFLRYTQSICVLVNEDKKDALSFYFKAGFRPISHYDTVFLTQTN